MQEHTYTFLISYFAILRFSISVQCQESLDCALELCDKLLSVQIIFAQLFTCEKRNKAICILDLLFC